MRPLYTFALVVAILFLLAVARLARLDAGGPAHQFVNLPGQEPATLYLPGEGNPFFRVFPPDHRPPAIVMVHGFTADRQFMSTLARRIAQNGYAVLAIDVSGHGANRNPFPGGLANADALRPDVRKAVDFLRSYQFVDGSRIAVMGHSMGASAALDYATVDPALKGAIMISGGFSLTGPERPKNALFIFAQNDPSFIQSVSTEIASHLAGVPRIELGKTYGEFQQGNAVEAIQIPRVNHLTIAYSPEAAATMVKWLDGAFGTARTGELDLREPRRNAALLAVLLFVVLLIPLGKIGGEIAGEWPEGPGGGLGGWPGLAILVVALLTAMPLVAMIVPTAFFPLVVGDVQVAWFWAAGVILVIVLIRAQVLQWPRLRDGLGATVFAALLVMTIIYLSQVADQVGLHTLSLTPERLIFTVVGTLLLLPFWLGFEFMLRRGDLVVSTIRATIGRALIIVMLVVGIFLQVLPGVLMLILPNLILIYVTVEILAASAYSSSRNLMLIALVESMWFAWTITATAPITFML
jgi:dienelactone hydrolase